MYGEKYITTWLHWKYVLPLSIISSPLNHFRVRLTSWLSWGWILISNLGAQFLGVMMIYCLSSYLGGWKFGQGWLWNTLFTWSPPLWITVITWWCWTRRLYMGAILTQVFHSSKVLPTLFEETNLWYKFTVLDGIQSDGSLSKSKWLVSAMMTPEFD